MFNGKEALWLPVNGRGASRLLSMIGGPLAGRQWLGDPRAGKEWRNSLIDLGREEDPEDGMHRTS